MRALITVTRRTVYTSIVEMDKATFKRLDKALAENDGDAEYEVNCLIDTHDWQSDSLDSVDDFIEYKEKR